MTNPTFKHADRPEYELPQLLKIIGEVDSDRPLEEAVRGAVKAAASHAYNLKENLLIGIESVGSLLVSASQFPDSFQERDLLGIGGLIRHAAVQLQYVMDVEDEMNGILKRDTQAAEKGGTR